MVKYTCFLLLHLFVGTDALNVAFQVKCITYKCTSALLDTLPASLADSREVHCRFSHFVLDPCRSSQAHHIPCRLLQAHLTPSQMLEDLAGPSQILTGPSHYYLTDSCRPAVAVARLATNRGQLTHSRNPVGES